MAKGGFDNALEVSWLRRVREGPKDVYAKFEAQNRAFKENRYLNFELL